MSSVQLPRGTKLNEYCNVRKLFVEEDIWDIYETSNDAYALVMDGTGLIERWDSSRLLPAGVFSEIEYNGNVLSCIVSDPGSLITSVQHGPYADNYFQAYAFAQALKETRKITADVSINDGIFIEKYSRILPTYRSDRSDDAVALGTFIANGFEISALSFDTLCKAASWLKPSLISEVVKLAGFSTPSGNSLSLENKKEDGIEEERSRPKEATERVNISHEKNDRFVLKGRPELEEFFNEHIVDIVLNAEKYKRMGIDFPSAVILHGPPGCGKTYAVERLVEFLGWPSYSIDSGSIGSPYIHDTSKKISEMFDSAIKNAPSVVIIDEMEAFLTDRNEASASGQHHVEEVAEFLRRIPEATSKNVIVIAMTNMIDKIDPAILRRGRFDHIVEVRMPSKKEVFSLLESELRKLPLSDDVDIDSIADCLAGHAMSDVTYIIKEAGRRAVKQDCEYISQKHFIDAIDTLPKKKEEKRNPIGFSID